MVQQLCFVVTAFSFLLVAAHAWAQSTVIMTAPKDNSISVVRTTGGETLVPNSLSTEARRWERILSENHPDISGTMRVGDLLSKLNWIGLPVYHDQSAFADDCDRDTEISVEATSHPLYLRLDNALKRHNAALVLMRDQFCLLSLDVISDPEHFCTIVYDITRLDADPYQIEYLIKASIDPDSWDDTNGDGALNVFPTNGRRFLVVSQTWPVHLSIRKMFAGIGNDLAVRTSQRGDVAAFNGTIPSGSSALTIPVPDSKRSLRVVQRGSQLARPRSGGIF